MYKILKIICDSTNAPVQMESSELLILTSLLDSARLSELSEIF